MFIGRTKELDNMNSRYEGGQFECAIIYGRRRVGKTTLINEFVKDKPTIYYTGVEGNANENLEGLSTSIYSYRAERTDISVSFTDFNQALSAAFEIVKKERIVFVIDEFPYLAESYDAVSSILQTLIDRNKDTSKMFLILCGSSLSFMENQVLGYESPLYGRRTCQYKIAPFTFFEMKDALKGWKPEDRAVVYGITGGIPLYLSFLNEKLSLKDNIKNAFLNTSAYLFEEPTNLIKQECRDPAQYNSVIRAIAKGASKMSVISSKTSIGTAHVSGILGKLISIGILKKETPFGEGSSRKTIYLIDDSMFRFWYRFIPDNMSAIGRGLADNVYDTIQPHVSDFMGSVFEEICKQYLWEQLRSGDVPIAFNDLGRWWGNDPQNKKETEIDIMGESDQNSAIFAECKWRNEKVDVGVLDSLVERTTLFHYTKTWLYLFSKTGFTSGCVEKAKAFGNVNLVKFIEM
ncbi:MAG: ATP-binding protein [Clostridiales Family XIII bacterium]|jgi:AAA+ ATPase superfamily predicted ATPase|nr:ATP-binding protein [Clostridiales Family XIII bacterium]